MKILIEILFSTLLLLFFTYIFLLFKTEDYERIKLQTFYALKSLDYNGTLRNLVFTNKSDEIEKEIKRLLPLSYEYKVCINCYLFFKDRDISSISYFISTNFTNIDFYEITVYIIKKE